MKKLDEASYKNINIGATAFLVQELSIVNRHDPIPGLLRAVEALFNEEALDCNYLCSKSEKTCSLRSISAKGRQEYCGALMCPLVDQAGKSLIEAAMSITNLTGGVSRKTKEG